MVENARETIARSLKVAPAQLVFTASGTEGNAFALYQAVAQKRTIITSRIEHDSVLKNAQNFCPDLRLIDITRNGQIDVQHLERLLQVATTPVLVSVMAVNNETGVIQPVREVINLCHQYQAWIHVDAAQAWGKIPIDCQSWPADFVSLTGHKWGGPMGLGLLVVGEQIPFSPLYLGGGQERRRRPGTENVPAIVGLAAAVEELDDLLERMALRAQWRDRLEQEILAATKDTLIHGQFAPRVAHVSNFGFVGMNAENQVMNMDLAGVAVSAGSACSSGKVTASQVLKAMGVDETLAGSSIRVSMGWATEEPEIDHFVKSYCAMRARVRV